MDLVGFVPFIKNTIIYHAKVKGKGPYQYHRIAWIIAFKNCV